MIQKKRRTQLNADEKNLVISGLIAEKTLAEIQADFIKIGSEIILGHNILSYYRTQQSVKEQRLQARNEVYATGVSLLHRRITELKESYKLLCEEKSLYRAARQSRDAKPPSVSVLCELIRTEIILSKHLSEVLGETDERRGVMIEKERKAMAPEQVMDLEDTKANPLYNVRAQILDEMEAMFHERTKDFSQSLPGANAENEHFEPTAS